MYEVSNEKNEVLSRVSPIVEKLIQGNSLFQVKLNKEEMIQSMENLFEKFSPEEMRTITDNELSRRIRKIMMLEAVSGTLNDLAPDQIEIFDAAVEGR
ncbi:hypothetical protein [Argonema galeatum]|uniref:hypothetical protein n=1 Tax=Argonema galeatum TaxID=2942762 RepID=UPI0020116348|nr:hypothetical protein [Argonema galeatum]MCL1463586.1 hypothetical protein [Argonema galeatum A003/A1]